MLRLNAILSVNKYCGSVKQTGSFVLALSTTLYRNFARRAE